MKYYKITGLNEGVPITPFAVTQDQLDAALVERGDSCRYYEEITEDEYNSMVAEQLTEMVAKELVEFEASHLDDPQNMLDVIKLLLERKFSFDVRNCSMIDKDEPLWQYVPDRAKGKDLLLLIVQISNYEWVVLEDDLETLTDCFRDIEGWSKNMNENNPVVVNDMPLEEFFDTDEGHNLWDDLHLQLVLNEEVVFDLIGNYSVEQDDIELVNPTTNEYTDNAKKYVVTGYCVINEVNYVFIKKIA